MSHTFAMRQYISGTVIRDDDLNNTDAARG
jgi:hypothetical protein